MDFFEIHQGLPREGPGNNESTKQALQMLGELPNKATVLDIGCGPGMQTIELAKHVNGKITALDPHQPFLDVLSKKVQTEKLSAEVEVQQGSMFELEFPRESFDLIWSEGAIFIIGFERGIKEWRQYIKQDGFLAVSELSWLRNDIPDEPLRFWQKDYPGMNSISKNIKTIEESGYRPVGHFVLPESAWWDDYYKPMLKRISKLREKYQDNSNALERLEESEAEIKLYRQYSDYYGYVFYVMQKVD